MTSTSPSDVSAILARAKRMADSHNWSEASDICQEALELAPGDINVLGQTGWYLSCAKRYDEAISVFLSLVQKEPTKAKWPYMIGYQYYDQEQWSDALKWFDRALELWDSYLVVLYRKGIAHLRLNQVEPAEQAFQKCIAVWRGFEGETRDRGKKYYSDACYQLGKILHSRRQPRAAEQWLAEAVQHGPPDAHKHYSLGKALLANGKPREALSPLQEANRMEPGRDYILVYIARAQIALQNLPGADSALERIPPRRRKGYVWREIGKLRLRQQRPEEAAEALQKAARLEPSNHNHHYLLGRAFEATHRFSEAYQAYVRAIELRGKHYTLDFPEAEDRAAALREFADASEIPLETQVANAIVPDGHIKTFKDDRGFGFISRDGEKDLFFHISDVHNPDKITVGAAVKFDEEDSPKGPRATRVEVLEYE